MAMFTCAWLLVGLGLMLGILGADDDGVGKQEGTAREFAAVCIMIFIWPVTAYCLFKIRRKRR